MSLLSGLFSKAAGAVVLASAFMMSPTPALAQHGGGHMGGGGFGGGAMGGGMGHIGGGPASWGHMGGPGAGLGGGYGGLGPGAGPGMAHHLGGYGGYGGYGRGFGGYGGLGGFGGLGLLGFGPFGYGPGFGLGYGGGYGMGYGGGYGLGYGGGYGMGYGGYPYYGDSYSYPSQTYSRGYSSAPSTTSAPYLTNQYYEPGDGYRYPLYYDPVNRTYLYYPVAR